MGKQGVAVQIDDNKILVFGWVAVILGVGITVAIIQLSAALAIVMSVLSGFGGLCMLILSVGKAKTWLKLADAEILRRKVELVEAQTERWRLADHVRRLTSGKE